MQQDLPGLEPISDKTSDDSILEFLAGLDDSDDGHNRIILTPNQPLAQQLRRLRLQRSDRKNAPGGKIQVFSAWLADSVTAVTDKPIANEAQLRLLWQLALQKNQSKFPDLNPVTLAPQALGAWRNLKRYQVPADKLRNAEMGQLVHFSGLIKEFESLLRERGLSALELEIEKQPLLAQAETKPEKNSCVHLYAFIEQLPPLFDHWLNHHFDAVNSTDYFASDYLSSESAAFLHPAVDVESELVAAGNWAREILDENSHARIGIVHSGLSEQLNKSIRLVESTLPENTRFSTSIQPALFQIGILNSALSLIRLNLNELDNAQARAIIHTPFWSDFQEEYDLRCQWDINLCNLQRRQIKTAELRELISTETIDADISDAATSLQQRLLGFFEAARRVPRQQQPNGWAGLFHRQLDILGWPGPEVKEADQTLLQHWLDALRDFSDLGAISGDIELGEALSLLQRCCDARRTDPGAAEAGVRLLDTVEGAADFTHLWLIGVDHMQWPGAPAPNPLLPVSLQREYAMPRATAEQETSLGKKLIERALSAAQQIVFSYAQAAEGLEQKQSGLLPELPLLPESLVDEQPAAESPEYDLEIIETEFAPAISESERQVAGGSSLLRTMASSPFDAFVQWRLGATALPEPKIGLDAAERGTLVHWVLDSVWKKLTDSDQLKQLSDDEREALCLASAQKEIKRWQKRHGWLGQAHAEIEAQRLSKLVRRWLDVELGRNPFEILQSEEKLTAELGGLTFSLRLDRLDKLSDGSLLLVDYKTGQGLSAKHWLEMPPSEPQMPLYAISLEQAPDAICFAQVRPDQTRLIGIGREGFESGFSQVDQWDELLELWRLSLTELAKDYARGVARVDETLAGFGRGDPLAPLHRMNEYEPLTDWQERRQ